MNWGYSKQYSGDFIDGKRAGTGKYINEYVLEGERQKVVYSGAWKQDRMDGDGTLTRKATKEDGVVRMNEIQTGTFKNGSLLYGYDVIHAVADPDFSFSYRSNQETLQIMGGHENLKASLKQGTLFSIDYRKGSIRKSCSIFPADTKAAQREQDAALKYLQGIQTRLGPYMEEFERLSKQVPLK
ncbi:MULTISPECIES: hypothetical protein [unclassified Paenibacillus]|uniref:hypothetical protein n=1 Tax=unclassified Paenibacillus TaxID=185978 RepID=UPI0009571068|nr:MULTISPECIES: hypothetical protein [unclassified Paenibacillus]ASS67762.1 hypothetical protein CIC07_17630 [Paenibacillus sp. RUD330]SIR61320.1 MORN repeat-containing protein [Paenibacillus sp. RU4X]SIR69946.1 MORN repeat-containing protein [Paenibacillus sp. RU4T]